MVNSSETGHDRVTAIGLARYGREYLDAATLIHASYAQTERFVGVPSGPVLYLIGHSIELTLKAYLRHRGFLPVDLRAVGRSLERAKLSADRVGLTRIFSWSEQAVAAIAALNEVYVAKDLEYIVTGTRVLPVFEPLEELAQGLSDAVCRHLGFPNAARLTEGEKFAGCSIELQLAGHGAAFTGADGIEFSHAAALANERIPATEGSQIASRHQNILPAIARCKQPD